MSEQPEHLDNPAVPDVDGDTINDDGSPTDPEDQPDPEGEAEPDEATFDPSDLPEGADDETTEEEGADDEGADDDQDNGEDDNPFTPEA